MARAVSCALALFATVLVQPLRAATDDRTLVTSTAPEDLAVTIYREPGRAGDADFDVDWLRGYALITETRTVDLPAGAATVRFEGVAGGILAETALVAGLPAGVREQNLDADLIGARNLYARSYGRPVTLVHADPRTGAAVEEAGVIRSGPDGAAIVQTREGFRTARCAWGDEYLRYDSLPEGLVARPTLSVATVSPAPVRARLRLSYLAWGFDWRADYVLAMQPDGRHADVEAWITLASSDATAFVKAATGVVAGEPEKAGREDDARLSDGQDLTFHCDVGRWLGPPPPAVVLQPPPPPPPMLALAAPAPVMDIMVTAARRPVMAVQEALGDLKFYRVPMPTTIAAHGQKQVALARREAVPVTAFYKGELAFAAHQALPLQQTLRLANTRAGGLGLALPAGHVVVLEPHGQAMLPVGEGRMDDKAVGEDVEIELARSGAVSLVETVSRKTAKSGSSDHVAQVFNARNQPALVELTLPLDAQTRLSSPSAPLARRNGQPLWRVTIPPHSSARLTFHLARARNS